MKNMPMRMPSFKRTNQIFLARKTGVGDEVIGWMRGCPTIEKVGEGHRVQVEYDLGVWSTWIYKVGSWKI